MESSAKLRMAGKEREGKSINKMLEATGKFKARGS